MENKIEEKAMSIWVPLGLSVFGYFFALWIMILEWDIGYVFYLVTNGTAYFFKIFIESLGYLGPLILGFVYVLLAQFFSKARRNKEWRRKIITYWATAYIVYLAAAYFLVYLHDKELFDNRWVCHEYDQSIQLTPRQKEIKYSDYDCKYIYGLEEKQGPRPGGHRIKYFYERSKSQ